MRRYAVHLYLDKPDMSLGRLAERVHERFNLNGEPAYNTLRSWIADYERDRTQGGWSLAARPHDTSETNPAATVHVLRHLMDHGQLPEITIWKATVISRIACINPNLAAADLWHLTRALIAEQRRDEPDPAVLGSLMTQALVTPEEYAALATQGQVIADLPGIVALVSAATGTGSAHNATVEITENGARAGRPRSGRLAAYRPHGATMLAAWLAQLDEVDGGADKQKRPPTKKVKP